MYNEPDKTFGTKDHSLQKSELMYAQISEESLYNYDSFYIIAYFTSITLVGFALDPNYWTTESVRKDICHYFVHTKFFHIFFSSFLYL